MESDLGNDDLPARQDVLVDEGRGRLAIIRMETPDGPRAGVRLLALIEERWTFLTQLLPMSDSEVVDIQDRRINRNALTWVDDRGTEILKIEAVYPEFSVRWDGIWVTGPMAVLSYALAPFARQARPRLEYEERKKLVLWVWKHRHQRPDPRYDWDSLYRDRDRAFWAYMETPEFKQPGALYFRDFFHQWDDIHKDEYLWENRKEDQ